jgi:hypothetical protein
MFQTKKISAMLWKENIFFLKNVQECRGLIISSSPESWSNCRFPVKELLIRPNGLFTVIFTVVIVAVS